MTFNGPEFDAELDAYLRRIRRLDAERRTPFHGVTREDQNLADLRAIIHILASAMNHGKAVA